MKSSEPLRVGILQTDSVREQFRPRFGDYPQMFIRLLGAVDAEVQFAVYPTHRDCFRAPDVCDAYVITGSRCSVYDEEPWIGKLATFVGEAMDAHRKIVGICFGHQLVAHFFGGRVAAAEVGWGVGVHRVEVVADESWMQPPRGHVALLSSHKDQVMALPRGARLIAGSDFCPNAAYVMDGVLTWQGHPEFTRDYAAALMRTRESLLGARTFDAGMASLDQPTDEQLIARWIMNFIREVK